MTVERYVLKAFALLCFMIAIATSASAFAMQGPGGEVQRPSMKPPSNPTVKAGTAKPESSGRSRRGGTSSAASLSNQVEAAIDRGNKERSAKHFAEAEKAYQRAIALNPNEARAYYGLGNVLVDEQRAFEDEIRSDASTPDRRIGDPIPNFRKALEIKPDYAEAHYALGNYLLTDPDDEQEAEGTKECKIATDLKPTYVDAHFCLASEFLEKGAREMFQSSESNHRSHYLDLALEEFKVLIRLSPADSEVYVGMGSVYREMKNFDEAMELFRQAVRLNPDNAYAHRSLGYGYLRVKNKEAAMKEYQELKRLKSEDADYLLSEINKP